MWVLVRIGMGGGGRFSAFEDVSKLPKITARLLAAGYSEKDLRQIWGENVLRVLRNAEQYAATCKPS